MRDLVATRIVEGPGIERPRRLRANGALRALVRETRLASATLVAPLFVVTGRGRREEISSLRGHARLSPDLAVTEAHRLARLGVGGVLLFGIPEAKDHEGRAAADRQGPVAEALRLLTPAKLPLALVADVCLCESPTHGHCAVLDGDQ